MFATICFSMIGACGLAAGFVFGDGTGAGFICPFCAGACASSATVQVVWYGLAYGFGIVL